MTEGALQFELDDDFSSRGSGAYPVVSPRHSSEHDQSICGHDVTTLLTRLARPSNWADSTLSSAMLALKPECVGDDGFEVELLTEALQRAGHHVQLAVTVPTQGTKSRKMLEHLHHKFILAQRDGASVIVEPRFKDQFLIAQPTADYACLMDALPEVFVGPPQRLRSLVEALCPLVARTFATKRQALPPWRCAAAVLSKWQLSTAPSDRGLASFLGLLQNPAALLGPAAPTDSPPRVARQGSATAQQQRRQRSPQPRAPEQPAQQQASSPAAENGHMGRQRQPAASQAGVAQQQQQQQPAAAGAHISSAERARRRSKPGALQTQSDLADVPSADQQRPSGQLTRRSAPPAKATKVHVFKPIEEGDPRLRTYLRHSTPPRGAWAPGRPSAEAAPQAEVGAAASTGTEAQQQQQQQQEQQQQPAAGQAAVQVVVSTSSEGGCPEQELGQQRPPRDAAGTAAHSVQMLQPGKPGSGPRQVHLLASSPDWRTSEACRQRSGQAQPEPEPGPAARS